MGSCISRMTGGERRLAQRLGQKLDADYLLWYDVPIGPRHLHPDFVVPLPRRGVLILEVKDWSPKTVQQADKHCWQVLVGGQLSRSRPIAGCFAQRRFRSDPQAATVRSTSKSLLCAGHQLRR